jgi:hypothetical protein
MVEPGRNAAGHLVCPLCRNTGRIQAAQPAPAAPPPASADPQAPPPGAVAPAPRKALAALIVGIAAVVVAPLGLLLGPAALVLGVQALRRIKRLPPGTGGQGMAIAGIVLGGVGIMLGITVLLALLVFVLVSDLAAGEQWAFAVDATGVGGVLTVEGYPGLPSWDRFGLGGSAECRLPTGDVDYGDRIVCTTDGTVLLTEVATGEVVYSATV